MRAQKPKAIDEAKLLQIKEELLAKVGYPKRAARILEKGSQEMRRPTLKQQMEEGDYNTYNRLTLEFITSRWRKIRVFELYPDGSFELTMVYNTRLAPSLTDV